MTAAQRRNLPTAMRLLLTGIADRDLLPGSMRIAEHGDGSGAWHIIAECMGDGGDERTLRLLIETGGIVGEIVELDR